MIQRILICISTGLIIKTFWFSYILFLIFLGGLLVLFTYVTSLASNELFKLSKISLIIIILFIIFVTLITLISDKIFYLFNLLSPDNNILNYSNNFYSENALLLNKLFNFPINIFSIMLIIYLFLTLLAVVKITNIFEGPLRPKI